MATEVLHRTNGAAIGSATPGTGTSEPHLPAAPPAVHAFFDLDRTLLRTSSLVAAAAALSEAGLVRRRIFLSALVRNVVFARRGCSDSTVERVVAEVLEAARGKEQAALASVEDGIRERLAADMRPTMVAALARHRAEGHHCVIVSASPIEVVRIAAAIVDADDAFGTVAEVDADGRYTGRLDQPVCYGSHKVRAIELSGRSVDWAKSWVYSDAASDLPLLEAVGRPVAVSPDRRLRRIASQRAWRIQE